MKYYDHGVPHRESTGTCNKSKARRILQERLGRVARGEAILPRADRMRYEEVSADLRQYYQVTGARNLEEAEDRLKYLDAFFRGRRLATIGPADITTYSARRQNAGAANGTINRELAILGRMLRLSAVTLY